jgi:hypothetical protein
LEHVVVPREHLAQLWADVRLRALRRHLPESTDASPARKPGENKAVLSGRVRGGLERTVRFRPSAADTGAAT